MQIRLASINIWDLPLPLPGLDRRRRRTRLLRALADRQPDLVIIQEAFIASFKARLLAALPDHHADAYARRRRVRWLLPTDRSGGLLTLSRWPIVRSSFVRSGTFHGRKPDERFAGKGCLWTEIDTPAGRLLLGNVHLYAGRSARGASVRARQASVLVPPPDPENAPVLMAGDFNVAVEYERNGTGPTVFDVMRERGFAEIAGGRSDGIETLDPRRNGYARFWRRYGPPCRFEQFFYRGRGLAPGRDPPALCFHDPPVSDHFGLCAGFEIG